MEFLLCILTPEVQHWTFHRNHVIWRTKITTLRNGNDSKQPYYNTLTSEMKINGQLQHITVSSDNWRSITTRYDQFLQLKVNHKTLRSVLITKGQIQHVTISSDNQRSIHDTLRSVLILIGQLQCVTSHWQTLSFSIVSSTPCQRGIWAHNVSGDKHWLHRYICSYKSNLP